MDSSNFALITDKYISDIKILGYKIEDVKKYLYKAEKENYIEKLKTEQSELLESRIASYATIQLYEKKPYLDLESLRQFYDSISDTVASLMKRF